MVPFPDFTSAGILPPWRGSETSADRSPYFVSAEQIAERMGASAERRTILRGLVAYRAELRQLGFSQGWQLIDGSFVEDVEKLRRRPPSDVDIMSFLWRPDDKFNTATDPQAKAEWDAKVVDKNRNKALYKVDPKALDMRFVRPDRFFQQSCYWTSLFGHQKATGRWKGFLLITMDDAQDSKCVDVLDKLDAVP